MNCFLIYSQFLPLATEPSLKSVDSGDQDVILEFNDDYSTEEDIIFKFGNSSAFISPESIDGISVENGGENVPMLLLYPSPEAFDEDDEPSQLFTNADNASAGSNIAAYTMAFTVSNTSAKDSVNLVFRGRSDKFIDFNADAPMWHQDPATVGALIGVLRNIIRAPGTPGVYPEFYQPGVFRFDLSDAQYEPLARLINYAASNLGIVSEPEPVYVAAPQSGFNGEPAQPAANHAEPAHTEPRSVEQPQTQAPAQPIEPQASTMPDVPTSPQPNGMPSAAAARSGGLLAKLRGQPSNVAQEKGIEQPKLPTLRNPMDGAQQEAAPSNAEAHGGAELPKIDLSRILTGHKQPAGLPTLTPAADQQKASPVLPPIQRTPQLSEQPQVNAEPQAQPNMPEHIEEPSAADEPIPVRQEQDQRSDVPQSGLPGEPEHIGEPSAADEPLPVPQEQDSRSDTAQNGLPGAPQSEQPRPAAAENQQSAAHVTLQNGTHANTPSTAHGNRQSGNDIFALSGIKLESGLGARMRRPVRDLEIALMAATAAKGFTILGGLNGAGKTRLALDFAETIQANDADTSATLIPVCADWNDSSELIGCRRTTSYASDFMSTEFNEALIDCCDNPDRSVFVILEEMTLARPEFYMAEVLSAMELREQEVIPCGSRKCRLPKSLFIIGTANIDEAPCPFSPKVLDRCFYIRMRAGDVQFDGAAPADGLTFREAGMRFIRVMRGGDDALAPLIDSIRAEMNIEGLLSSINGAQGNHSVAFGYRTRDEIYSFMANFMYISGCSMYDPGFALRALDWAIVTKLLPKFRGLASDLNAPLEALERRLQEKGLLSRTGPDSVPWRSRGELTYIRHQLDTKSSASYC